MGDIIHLLPDNVANQIAAGEVIQRPASVVKELLENAIDAGATQITLSVKDAGKTLIQVSDNGKGMSDSDARMSFERHATSKISTADELFDLHTKGFRGEALASIASIAHVELKTKREEDELGSCIEIEGSKVISQEPIATSNGTTFSVKNLFFNVPARRQFLKSDSVENKHIIEEFIRVALPHFNIEMRLIQNDQETYHLPSGNLKQRVVNIFGRAYNERLVPIDEDTSIVELKGFVGKPENAKKTRGEQYLFVNDRYIKSTYLNHAVKGAFDDLISSDQFPSYFLFMQVDPKSIDVNIHPTKTEVKFEEERSIYAIIKSAVRNSLGKYNVVPTLDFEQEASFNQFIDPNKEVVQPEIKVNPDYNPFKTDSQRSKPGTHQPSTSMKPNTDQWESLYEVAKNTEETIIQTAFDEKDFTHDKRPFLQLNDKYVLGSIRSGYMVIDQYRAHYRILFDTFLKQINHRNGQSQGLIFPETVELNANDFKQINVIEDELESLGFRFTKEDNTLQVTAKPSELADCDSQALIEDLLEEFKLDVSRESTSPAESLAKSMASKAAVRKGKKLTDHEMNDLVDRLFECGEPNFAPNGKKVMITITFDELEKLFG